MHGIASVTAPIHTTPHHTALHHAASIDPRSGQLPLLVTVAVDAIELTQSIRLTRDITCQVCVSRGELN
jgi:hypothetical protein